MSARQTPPLIPERQDAAIHVVDNEWVEMADGVRLAVRLWLPNGSFEEPVPAILTSVPYRKSDGTAIGDAAWGSYFAKHGFAYARVDIRGSGDSEGVIEDEYTPQEQADTEQVIDWLAHRPWCTGAVGMIGISWGGFAGLQMAARHPEALRGVVAIHASDDRYSDDVHYIGGCVSAMDMTQWATSMLAYLSQPPDPQVVGPRWRQQWLERLEATSLFIAPWLAHQRRDEYWQQGSACEDYAAIRCPVFAIGGWSDGYRDMVLRVVEHARAPVRGIIGPWGHTHPEEGAPGPAIGFLQECVRFFGAALAGEDNGFFDEPRLISYLQEPVPPAGSYPRREGRWVADPCWPSPSLSPWTLHVGSTSLSEALSDGTATARMLRGLQTTGLQAGVWCGDGSPGDFALDQRPDDGASLCWDSQPLTERIEILGCGEARLRVSVDRPQALLARARVRRRSRWDLDARRAGAAESQPPGGPRPQRPDAGWRAGRRPRPAAVDRVRAARRTPGAARGVEHLLALGLALARERRPHGALRTGERPHPAAPPCRRTTSRRYPRSAHRRAVSRCRARRRCCATAAARCGAIWTTARPRWSSTGIPRACASSPRQPRWERKT